jgi:hypothetical protein
VAKSEGGLEWHDRRTRFASIMVTATDRPEGLVDLPYEIDVARSRPIQAPAPEVAG